LEVLEAVKKASEAKKEKEIITDESNFPQVNDKNNQISGEENKINHSSNNMKENKNSNQNHSHKINTNNDNNFKSTIKTNNHNVIDKKNLTINNQKERISTAPNKVNYIKKNKEAKFNNNTIIRNNAPLKKTAKSPDLPVKLSNTMQSSTIKVGHGVLPKKISPQVRSNKDNKFPKGKSKINIENNNLKISNKKIVIKPGMRPCKTGESKIGKSPGLILNKNKK
jgi:hypothetical protein